MAASNYAVFSDIQAYVPEINSSADGGIIDRLCASVSRFIDLRTGQFFYDDGQQIRFFDGQGIGEVSTNGFPFFGKVGYVAASAAGATSLTFTSLNGVAPIVGDTFYLDYGGNYETPTVTAVTGTDPTYTLTVPALSFAHVARTPCTTIQIQLAYFENQPLPLWINTLAGNGMMPGSNYFLWPRNRGRAATTAMKPWYGLDLANIPVSGTTFLPGTIPGYLTVEINARWGWPVVPDTIKNLAAKVVARAWRARGDGWRTQVGDPQLGGVVDVSNFFDKEDLMVLKGTDLAIWSQG